MADQTSTTTTSGPSWLQPYWESWLGNVMGNVTSNPPTPYGGPTVAPWSQNQMTAADMMRQLAMNGTPAYNSATAAIPGLASGQTESNPFGGMSNPYFGQMVTDSNADISKAYREGTARQLDAMAARTGAYGGTDYMQALGTNQDSLLRGLARNTNELYSGQYDRSANLWGQDAARGLQGQIAGIGLGLGSQASDMSAIGGLFGMGQQQQQDSQAVLDAMKQYWTQQQQSGYAANDIVGNALSRAAGTGGTSTTSVNGGDPSNWANWIAGLGLLSTFW